MSREQFTPEEAESIFGVPAGEPDDFDDDMLSSMMEEFDEDPEPMDE